MTTAKERRAARARAAAAEPTSTASTAAIDATAGSPDPESDEILEEARARSTRPPKSTIHRLNPETGARLWLAEVATDLISEEYIARRFGGGRYYVGHRRAEPGGGYVYDSHSTFDLDPSLKPDPAPANGNGHAVTAPAAAAGPISAAQLLDVGILQLLRQIEQGNEAHRAMLERMVKVDQAPRGPGPYDEILKVVAPVLVKGLLDLMTQRADPIDQALKLRKLVPESSTPDVFSALEKTLAIASRLNGRASSSSSSSDDGGGDGMSTIILEALRTLQGIIGPRANGAAPNGEPIAVVDAPAAELTNPHQFSPPAPAPADPAVVGNIPPQPVTPSSSSDRPWLAAARPQLPTLLQFARLMPADAAASTIANNLTAAQLDDLLEDLEDQTAPGFFGRLAQQFPAAVAGAPAGWLEQVADVLLSWSDDDDGDGEESPAASSSTPAAPAK